MTSFILEVLQNLKNSRTSFSDITFVLPSRRAGLFLKSVLPNVISNTEFSPEIISIEEFIDDLSDLKVISNSELLFEFYSSYSEVTKQENRDSFEVFSKWAQVLLQDFNEIDRHLVSQKKIFNYLGAIQGIKHWSLEEPKTKFVTNYLSFWEKLYQYYSHFTKHLLDNKIGYQGLAYREAVGNIETYIQNNKNKYHVFLGFNALNKSEETIIQELLQNDLADIYWDIDHAFFNKNSHDTGMFTRAYKSSWNYYQKYPFNWIGKNYSNPKNITVYGVSKNVGQAKQIGSILSQVYKNDSTLNSTAVVLGDETLLAPVLNSLPKDVQKLNITMGFPLKQIPISSLFEQLFNIHKKEKQAHYYKDVINILSHQFIIPLCFVNGENQVLKLIDLINKNNFSYLTCKQLKQLSEPLKDIIELLFGRWENDPEKALKNSLKLIFQIKAYLNKEKSSQLLSLEYLYRFNELFNELSRLTSKYNHVKNIKELHSLYKELLNLETLDFSGEPLNGLQVMGMLESRVLDFETVIISSVNEGILPAGKTNNSFIPFDVKLENSLPTYKEKDAVYSYHFYRLLQRAKNVHILYNTESDVLMGGEKSRFITQLELEGIHNITHKIIAPAVPVINNQLLSVTKTNTVLQSIQELAHKGFSPSSLTNYMRDPLTFYHQKILGIKDQENVEETVASNTLGTVIHNTLEDIYKPLIGKYLLIDEIKKAKSKIEEVIRLHFSKAFKEGDITKGKNLIVFEIAKRYVSNFLDLEIASLKQGNKIKILAIEAENRVSVNIEELNFPILLTGKVDRVDEFNGVTRIIDYKTGKVDQNKVEIVNWDDITTDYIKFSKSFQVLTYAYMMNLDKQISLPVEAGIISFKNLKAGFLKFAKKDREGRGAQKETLISEETLNDFESQLKQLILEICNKEIAFTQKLIE